MVATGLRASVLNMVSFICVCGCIDKIARPVDLKHAKFLCELYEGYVELPETIHAIVATAVVFTTHTLIGALYLHHSRPMCTQIFHYGHPALALLVATALVKVALISWQIHFSAYGRQLAAGDTWKTTSTYKQKTKDRYVPGRMCMTMERVLAQWAHFVQQILVPSEQCASLGAEVDARSTSSRAERIVVTPENSSPCALATATITPSSPEQEPTRDHGIDFSAALQQSGSSPKELCAALDVLVNAKMFSLRVARSDYKKGAAIISCGRSGVYEPKGKRRQTSTKRTGCMFRFACKRGNDSVWRATEQIDFHNHRMSDDLSVHPKTRQLTAEQKERCRQLQLSGVKPSARLDALRQEFTEIKTVMRDVYSDMQNERQAFLGNRTPIQVLIDLLNEHDYTYHLQQDSTGRIARICYAHPLSLTLLLQHHHVILLDATYKTNKFKMPLLVCTGLTPTNRSFLGCAIFMSGETEDDYAWATSSISTLLGDFGSPQVIVTDNEAALLKATKHTFPAAHFILCRWRINRNIVKHCKKNFANADEWESLMSAWSGLCISSTQEQFELSWLHLQHDFEQYPSAAEYIESTWLSHKEKFVDAWIGKKSHLGCVTTSRAESSNSFLKKFLSSSIGDLLAVFQETHLAIQHQVHELKKDIADNKFKQPGFTCSLSYENVVHKVSNYALTEVNRHKTNSTSVSCSTSFTSTMGLPCVHVMRVRENNNEPLRLSDFHHYWHLDRVSFQPSRSTDLPAQTLDVLIPETQQTFQTAPPQRQLEVIEAIKDAVRYGYGNRLQDPQVARTKGRPNGARSKSTKRNPSGFEYAKNTRKCSKCKQAGHNLRTCSQHLRPEDRAEG